jgi:hypothetical protein
LRMCTHWSSQSRKLFNNSQPGTTIILRLRMITLELLHYNYTKSQLIWG